MLILMRAFLCALLLFPIAAWAQTGAWQMEQSGTTADLRGVHSAGFGVVWASGTGGTVLRSEDTGFEWQRCAMPPGAEKLDFRAVWGWDANTAVVMSSGPGGQSRLYETTDGCAHFKLLRTNDNPKGFWDGIAFSDRKNGYLLGDPIDGELQLERTEDGGHTWTRIHSPGLRVGKRGAFAASNSSMALARGLLGVQQGVVPVLWIGTGGPGGALVLSAGQSCAEKAAVANPRACAQHWQFSRSTLPLNGSTASSGIFALGASYSGSVGHGIAVGGDYTKPDQASGTAAWWSPKGWHAAGKPPGGYRSAVGWDAERKLWITVGANGSDLSRDGGKSWKPIERAEDSAGKKGEWNALSLPWAVGPGGRIGKLGPHALP